MAISMPPKKSPKPATSGAATRDGAAVLALLYANLEEMKRWYRGASDPGREMGHVVIIELNLSRINEALGLAIEGKAWSPPAHSP